MTDVKVRRALISVFDKEGLIDLARSLSEAGVEIVSSGGTASALTEAGIEVTGVSDVTGAPEILGGRVKTLHPAIHGGILGRPELDSDTAEMAANGIEPFQLVVVNLYPFRETVADPDSSFEQIIEKIDIGGPAMVRAAAKNHRYVGVVTSPAQYAEVAAAVAAGGLSDELRSRLAAAAFLETASYDAAIAAWMGTGTVIALEEVSSLRYGENPHQGAALLAEAGTRPWWLDATLHQGKEMSFNNYADTEAAWALACDLPAPAVVVVKHTNPAGAATASTVGEAFENAWAGDSLAAFGGVVAINGKLDEPTAGAIAEQFVEVVVAADIEQAALDILGDRKNLRVLTAPPPEGTGDDFRRISGGFLRQDRDRVELGGWDVVSERMPSEDEMEQLRLAWTIVAHTKSNAIVICKEGAAVGVGAGDQSRVGAAERAVVKAGERAIGGVAASDAFFPFRDGPDALAAAGVTAIVEPGGSVRDQDVIDAANEHGMALVFTGRRHFRH
jgi:phosphoribosylaminoimidazolecarboxamide formyltransferase/IMP cyclohydrolase